MGIADEIEKLKQLHDSGELSDSEYAEAKAKLLASAPDDASERSGRGILPDLMGGDDRSLGAAANRYVTFRIVMGVIGLIGFVIVLLMILGSHMNGPGP